MKNNKLIHGLIKMTMLAGMVIAALKPVPVSAAGATVTLSTDSNCYAVGETFTLEIELSADVVPGRSVLYLTYDYKTVKFVSKDAADYVTGGDGVLTVSSTGVGEDSSSKTYAVRFTTRKEGIVNFGLKNTSEVYSKAEGQPLPLAVIGCSVTVGEKITTDPAETVSSSGDSTTAEAAEVTGSSSGTSDISVSERTDAGTVQPQTDAHEGSSPAYQPGNSRALSPETAELIVKYRNDLKELTVVIVILLVICILLLIVTIKLAFERSRRRKGDR